MLNKRYWIQSKSYSGFFRVSRNNIPFGLVLDNSNIVLKILGFIPYLRINLADVISFHCVGNTWVAMSMIFDGVVIKYRKGNSIEERVFSFIFNKNGSLEFVESLRNIMGEKEEKVSE